MIIARLFGRLVARTGITSGTLHLGLAVDLRTHHFREFV